MSKTIKRIINLSAIGLILVIVLAGNIVCGMLFQMITEAFHGSGVSFKGNKQLDEVLTKGDELCGEIEAEGAVLLKKKSNEAPLKGVDKVNVFGWAGSDAGWTISGYGSGASRIPEERQIMLYKSLEESNISYNKELAEKYKAFRNKRTGLTSLNGGYKFFTLHEPDVSFYSGAGANGKTLLENAKDYSSTAIIVIGRQSGEGLDVPDDYMYRDIQGTFPDNLTYDTSRAYLQLSPEEEDMIKLVKDNFENVIVLLNTTNIIEAGFIDDEKIDYAYWVGAPGQSGTRAIPKILKGEINPSGRTNETWAYNHKTEASYANAASRGNSGTGSITYAEDIYVGYRWFETADEEGFWNSDFAKAKWNIKNGYKDVVQYPFGYGLSYTDFEWKIEAREGEAITPAKNGSFNKDEEIKVTVSVTNVGSVAGKDVVQLYYKAPYKENGIEKPSIALAAYAKTVELKPGETQFLTLSFTPYLMASYDCYDKNHNRFSGYELEKGEYTICLARNVHDIVESFTYNLDMSYKYKEDPVTGTKVTNLMTGVNAWGGYGIDNKTSNPQLVYLTRNNFVGTFPEKRASGKVTSSSLGEFTSTAYDDETTMPKFGEDSGLHLMTGENGEKLTTSQLNNVKKEYKLNEELMLKLGGDYNASEWDTLLNQMTKDDMLNLIVKGGYHTEAVASIGKPWLRENDGPMGLTRGNASPEEVSGWTWYPMVGTLASSWNSRLAYRFGNVVSTEANLTGVHGWYAPGFNMIRSPYGGRNNEYYSEDPVFNGLFGSETVRAALNNNVSCYVKHFVANETETGRSGLRTWLTEQNLREVYLKCFEYAVKIGKANGVMSSFNRIGDLWSGANYPLMTQILRNEWGFKGAVITDWVNSAKGYMSGTKGVKAGNDLWLNGAGAMIHDFDMNDAVTLNCLRRSCKNVLYEYCNTYYISKNHVAAEDELNISVGIVEVNQPFPSWIFLLIGIDLIVVAGLTVWTIFVFRRFPVAKKEVFADGEVKK